MGKVWTNIGKKGSWTERQMVICNYVKDGVRRFRPVAHTGSLEEADYICKLLTEQYKDVEGITEFETFTDYVYHNTQINEGFLNGLVDEATTTDILKKIYQYEEEQEAKYDNECEDFNKAFEKEQIEKAMEHSSVKDTLRRIQEEIHKFNEKLSLSAKEVEE